MALSNTPSFQSNINKELEVFRTGVSDLAKEDGVLAKKISTIDEAIESLKPSTLVKGPGSDDKKRILNGLKARKAKLEGLKNEISKQTPSSVTKWVEKTIAKFHSDKELRELLPKSFLETLTQLRGVAKGNISIIKAREDDAKASLAQNTHTQAQKSIGASKRASHAVQTATTAASQQALGLTPANQAARPTPTLNAEDQTFIESLEKQVQTAFEAARPYINGVEWKIDNRADSKFLHKKSKGIQKEIDSLIKKAKSSKTPLSLAKKDQLAKTIQIKLQPINEANARLEAPKRADELNSNIRFDWFKQLPKTQAGTPLYNDIEFSLYEELNKGIENLKKMPLKNQTDLDTFNIKLDAHKDRMGMLTNAFLSLDHLYRSTSSEWFAFPKKGTHDSFEKLKNETMDKFKKAIEKVSSKEEIDDIVNTFRVNIGALSAPRIIESVLVNREVTEIIENDQDLINNVFDRFKSLFVSILPDELRSGYLKNLDVLSSRLREKAVTTLKSVLYEDDNLEVLKKQAVEMLNPLNELLMYGLAETTLIIERDRADLEEFHKTSPKLNVQLHEIDKDIYNTTNTLYYEHMKQMEFGIKQLADPSVEMRMKLVTIRALKDSKRKMELIQQITNRFIESNTRLSKHDDLQKTLKTNFLETLKACNVGQFGDRLTYEERTKAAEDAVASFERHSNLREVTASHRT